MAKHDYLQRFIAWWDKDEPFGYDHPETKNWLVDSFKFADAEIRSLESQLEQVTKERDEERAKYKVYGTGECPHCEDDINEFMGSKRVALFYMPSEHDIHERAREQVARRDSNK